MTDLASIARDLQQLAQRIAELAESSKKPLAHLDQPEPLHGVAMLTPTDLAKLIKVHPRTLRRLRLEGKIPEPLYLNSRPRWRRSDIDRWLEAPR